MFEILNSLKVKKSIENCKNEIPLQWKEMCSKKINKHHGGAYPQFNNTEELEKALIKAKWKRSKEVMIPENCELYVSDLEGQVELVNISSLSRDTLLYVDKPSLDTIEGTLYVKGINPGKINKSYLILETIDKKQFIRYFSTGEYNFPSRMNVTEFNTGDLITRQEALDNNIEVIMVKTIGLGINNKVPVAIRQTKMLDRDMWINGCKSLIQSHYTNYRTVQEFEKQLVNADWVLSKQVLSNRSILRYETNSLIGNSETVKLASLPNDVQLKFCRVEPENEHSNGYLSTVTDLKVTTRITILDVITFGSNIVVGDLKCGMPFTEMNSGAERYRHGEFISKREAMSLGFQYIKIE